jgi:sporulation protein YlmC with PRC-barrel domain
MMYIMALFSKQVLGWISGRRYQTLLEVQLNMTEGVVGRNTYRDAFLYMNS